MEKSQSVYSSGKIVRNYSERKDLQFPEQTIFNILSSELPALRMLDIGVGAGRTTKYFAEKANYYLGIDYSEEMIRECRRKFNEVPGKLEFKAMDLRNLSEFKENSFDFVFISFNGLDLISDEERHPVMLEIKRILAPNGWFLFSTHNLFSLDQLYKFEWRWNVFAIVKNVLNFYELRRRNNIKALMHAKRPVMIADGVHDFSLDLYYSDPVEQHEKLLRYGFRELRIFDLKSGAEIKKAEELGSNKDFYLYYLCRK